MKKPDKNWLEWTVFGVGAILVCSTVLFLAYDAWSGSNRPPILEVQVGAAEARAGHYAIPVRVFNRGDLTAEQVHVEVTLERSNGSSERAEFQIAFVPRQASRAGWVTFETNPADAKRIVARVPGYAKP